MRPYADIVACYLAIIFNYLTVTSDLHRKMSSLPTRQTSPNPTKKTLLKCTKNVYMCFQSYLHDCSFFHSLPVLANKPTPYYQYTNSNNLVIPSFYFNFVREALPKYNICV